MQTYSALSKDDGLIATTMTVDGDYTLTTITTADHSPLPDEAYTLFIPNTIPIVEGVFTIPNNGQKWWFVPFDSVGMPFQGEADAEDKFDCYCTAGGACKVSTTTVGTITVTCCVKDGCMACCKGILTQELVPREGSFFLIACSSLNFNGTIYQ